MAIKCRSITCITWRLGIKEEARVYCGFTEVSVVSSAGLASKSWLWHLMLLVVCL